MSAGVFQADGGLDKPDSLQSLLISLLCLAQQLKPELDTAALLPCKTWLHFHSETGSDSWCPASRNVSSSAKQTDAWDEDQWSQRWLPGGF